ncbi:MAG: FKBP-type peptidyl-prolyl cis-trans isomerase, partial [Actinomycetota bacterium]|nr:FKBP-type peptidyl-prolyl cis-trans isomerase [Actinomycetota bacterium]
CLSVQMRTKNSSAPWLATLVPVLFALSMVALGACSDGEFDDNSLVSLPRANEANEPPLPKMEGAPPADLLVRDFRQGSGEAVEGDRLLVINFVVAEWGSAELLDSTSRRGIARVWPYGRGKLIAGVEDGLEGMREGGRRLIVVPPELAYADEPLPGTSGDLPLVFVVDLIEVGPRPSEQS